MTEHGVEWTTPTGYTCPPEEQDTQPPVYPETLKILIDATLRALKQRQGSNEGNHAVTGELTENDDNPEAHPKAA